MSARAAMLERLPVRQLDGADSFGSAAAGRVVYTDATGTETTEAGFEYNDTTNVLSVDNVTLASTGLLKWSTDLILSREAAATLQMGADVNGAAVHQTLKAHDGITGTDVAGANITIAPGRGTGAGTVGTFNVQTATALASGTTAQTLTTRLTIDGTQITLIPPGAVVDQRDSTTAQKFRVYKTSTGAGLGQWLEFDANNGRIITNWSGSALTFGFGAGATHWTVAEAGSLKAGGNYDFAIATAANATGGTIGFLFMNSCAGAPTGVPATIPTGQKAFIYDSTNRKLYLYDGGWKKANVAAVDVTFD